MRKAVWLVFYWKCIQNHFSVCFVQHISYAELKYHDNPKSTEMSSGGSVSPSPNGPVLLQRASDGCISSWGCPPYPREPGQCRDQILGRLMQSWQAPWFLVQLHQSWKSVEWLWEQRESSNSASLPGHDAVGKVVLSGRCLVWKCFIIKKSFCKIREWLLATELSLALRADCMKIKHVRDMASRR